MLYSIIAILIAYLCGAIPVGYLIAKLYGVDVTTSGSGRTGGTNVMRAAGVNAAGLTVFGDVMKGLIPIFLLNMMADFHIIPYLAVALAAPATIVGHNYSVFLGFRGGAGGGTSIGALGGLNFWVGLFAAICALIALWLSRYASLLTAVAAVSGLIFLIIGAIFFHMPYEYIIAGVLNMLLIFYALRPNFERLRAGTERRIGGSHQS